MVVFEGAGDKKVTFEGRWQPLGEHHMMKPSTTIFGHVHISGRHDAKVAVSLNPSNGGSVSIRGEHFEATAEHLYEAGRRLTKQQLLKIVNHVQKYESAHTQPIKLPGREHIAVGTISESVPIKHGKIATTIAVKKGVIEVTQEISVDKVVSPLKGPRVHLTTAVTHTVSITTNASDKKDSRAMAHLIAEALAIVGTTAATAVVVRRLAGLLSGSGVGGGGGIVGPRGGGARGGGGGGGVGDEGDFEAGGGILKSIDD